MSVIVFGDKFYPLISITKEWPSWTNHIEQHAMRSAAKERDALDTDCLIEQHKCKNLDIII